MLVSLQRNIILNLKKKLCFRNIVLKKISKGQVYNYWKNTAFVHDIPFNETNTSRILHKGFILLTTCLQLHFNYYDTKLKLFYNKYLH